MMVLAISLLLAWQDDAGPKMLVWEEITLLETYVQKLVPANDTQFQVSNNNPVRGYYIEKKGVFLIVPVRYRIDYTALQSESRGLPGESRHPAKVDKNGLQIRLKEWRQRLQKEEILKEANFEKVVNNLKRAIPDILGKLQNLSPKESLTLVVEESVPAWYFASLSMNPNPTRKVVTLSVDNDLVAKVQADQTVLASDWLNRVKRSTTKRRLALIP